jgi:protein-S-isoprenylcysteine O-methyltransferase Ste14
MRHGIILLFLVCIVYFGWARRNYFIQTTATPSLRRGLRPIGTVLSVVNLVAIATSGIDEVGVQGVAALGSLIAALLLFFAAARAHGDSRPAIAFTPEPPRALTFGGPYRWVRHPIYTSYLLFWVGALIAAPNIVTGASIVVMFSLYLRAAIEEEQIIANSLLGEQYLVYTRRVGRFFPRLISRTRG